MYPENIVGLRRTSITYLKKHYNLRMANMFLDKENCSEALVFCINAKAVGHMHAPVSTKI